MEKQQENQSHVFHGGVPTQADVEKLRKNWPETELEPGDRIYYTELESVLNMDRSSYRYRTVLNRWRKILADERGIYLQAENAEAFVVLDESGKVDLAGKKQERMIRRARQTLAIIGHTNRSELDNEHAVRADHYYSVAAKTLQAPTLKSQTSMPKLTNKESQNK